METAFDRMVKEGTIKLQRAGISPCAAKIRPLCVEIAKDLAITRGWGLDVYEVLGDAAKIEDFILHGAPEPKK